MHSEEKARRVYEIEARMRAFVRRPCKPRSEDEGKRQVRVVIAKYGANGRATKRIELTGPNVGTYAVRNTPWRNLVESWLMLVPGNRFSIQHYYNDGSVRDFVPDGDTGPPRELD